MTNTERLDLLISNVAEIKGQLTQLAEHGKILHGNGQPGLIERVTKLEQSRKSTIIFFSVLNGLAVSLSAILTAIFTLKK